MVNLYNDCIVKKGKIMITSNIELKVKFAYNLLIEIHAVVKDDMNPELLETLSSSIENLDDIFAYLKK
jgi:hypothetical protein